MTSTGNVGMDSSTSLTLRNNNELPDMIELPLEVIKSSRTKVVEVNNLPPRNGALGSGRRTLTNQSAREHKSPSP